MSRYLGPLAGARLVLLFLAAWLASPLAASAVTHEMRILMDLDEDASTGCTVTTVDGPFSGAEQALIATVETSSPPEVGTVTDLALSDCDPVSGTFGAPSSFDGGWPVGVGLGVAGRDLVESYVPLTSLLVQSPLLDAIPVGTPVSCDGTEPTDQRGVTRPQSTGCDIGAVEVVVP